MKDHDRPLRLGLVGPCGAGKTTLKILLSDLPIEVRHIAQEHSYAPSMWQKISHPDILVFLDVSFEVAMRRRWLNWTLDEYQEQQRRLAHARQHCHLYIMTDPLSPEEVVGQIVAFLRNSSLL